MRLFLSDFTHRPWLEAGSNRPKQDVDIDDGEFKEKALSRSAMESYNMYKTMPGRTNQERHFILKMMKKYSKESLEPMLDAMPCAEDKIPKFDIINPSGISHKQLERSIINKAIESTVGLHERYMEDCEKAITARTRYLEMMKASREDELVKIDEALLDRLEAASTEMKELQKKMIDSLIEFSAHDRLKNARIMNGIVVIPKLKENIFALLTSSEINSDALILFSQMVSDRISQLLVDSGSFTEEWSARTFSFARKEIKVPFLIVKVSSRPMKSPTTFFKLCFLTHQDQIFTIERKNDPEDSSSALVLIHLGTDKIPPGKLVSDRKRFNKQYNLDSGLPRLVVESTLKLMKQFENSSYNDQYTVDMLAQCRSMLGEKIEIVRCIEEQIKALSRFPAHKPIYDRNQMKVQVIYPQQHCFLCLTSSHTSRDCKVKGCNICYGKNHSAAKCKFRCPCKRLSPHGIGECTHKPIEVDHKKRASLLEARIKNTERNRAYST